MGRRGIGDTDKFVLVTGATGRQGGAVIRHMLSGGWKLRALTRKPASRAAQDLACQGVELVKCGTKLTLRYCNVPNGRASYRDGGWQEHYFRPMKKSLSRRSARTAS